MFIKDSQLYGTGAHYSNISFKKKNKQNNFRFWLYWDLGQVFREDGFWLGLILTEVYEELNIFINVPI